MNARILWSLCLGGSLLGAAALAEERSVPPQLSFLPKAIELYDDGWGGTTYVHHDYGEAIFRSGEKHRGRYWWLLGRMTAAKGDARWPLLKDAFVNAGWTVASDMSGGAATLHSKKDPESWAEVRYTNTFGPDDVAVAFVEPGPNPTSLVLAQPAPTPEKIDEAQGDFPYLKPLAGATFKSGGKDDRPLMVTPPGSTHAEMVAPATLARAYAPPPRLSNLAFVEAYRDALTKAGWAIVWEFNSADAGLIAHYAKGSRDLWASLHLGGESMSIAVADVGGDLKAALGKDCHVALQGVLFDFNKSTLQPVSDGVLQRVRTMLTKNGSLRLEVQGHTDNVGDAAYNQKLSEARAAAVVKWLTNHGIGAARLSSAGFGMTRPVADNKTDEGRARNRRVEIADRSCQPKG
jgi:outer membrane protein OmpA-like peptidoglycan-associated protein